MEVNDMASFDRPSWLPPGLLTPFFAPAPGTAVPPLDGAAGDPNGVVANGAAATNAAAAPQPVPASPNPAGVPPSSLWGRLVPPLADNASTLMALGGGLAGARTWGEGIGRGLTQAAQTSLEQQKLDQVQRNQGMTYAMLVRQGVSPQAAIAAAQNPHLLSFVLRQLARGPERGGQ
jgi:hypothetical protein